MRIKRSEEYYIDLYEEPNDIHNHNSTFTGTLTFTGADLMEAIVSAGMPDVYLTKREKTNRKEEIEFKMKIFETFVASSVGGKLSFNASRKKYLDSTEVGAINYWIGMVLITVLGKKKYDYEFMVHLSKVELFSSKISMEKHSFISATGKTTFKSPDLLAINSSKVNTYGIFESKGYSQNDHRAMERGYIQAKSINKINGHSPKNSLVVLTQIGIKEIKMIEKDPEGENGEINIDLNLLYLYHFLPIAELIMELTPEERGNRVFGSLEYGEDSYSISIPLDLYKKLSQVIDTEKCLSQDNSILDFSFERTYTSKNEEKSVLCVE